MSTILLKNGTIINESTTFKGSIFIEDDVIADVYSYDDVDGIVKDQRYRQIAGKVIDLKELYVAPGVIDDHVHFREPGNTEKGSIATESAAAILGGVTSFLDMPNNDPPAITSLSLDDKFRIAFRDSFANYSFYLGATNDNLDEIKKVDVGKVCGIKVFLGASTGGLLVDEPVVLDSIFHNSPILIACHCEDPDIISANLDAAKARFGKDIPFSKHPEIRSREACVKSVTSAIKLAQKYNSRLHILHLSTVEEVEMLREMQLKTDRITGETCPQYLWFNDSNYAKYGPLIKCNPSIKTKSDMLALRKAVKEGVIRVIGSDHAPHLLEEKRRNYIESPSGMPVVQYSFQVMLELYKKGVFTLEEVVDRMSHSPAKCFGISKRGFLRKGYYADLVVFDTNKECKVNPASKCGWSPFDSFSTSVVHTFVNGRQVVKNGVITNGERNAMALEFER